VQHWVQLGNSDAVVSTRDAGDQVVRKRIEGDQITAIVFPECWGLNEMYAAAVASAAHHFARDEETGGHRPPAWVESSDEDLQMLVANHFGLGRTNLRPAGWTGDHPSVAALREREG